ncbi:hypothetical protein MY4824_009630 [Beauveria thailandica]
MRIVGLWAIHYEAAFEAGVTGCWSLQKAATSSLQELHLAVTVRANPSKHAKDITLECVLGFLPSRLGDLCGISLL